jgi:hypothetical protein
MLMISALSMTVALCLQAVLSVVLTNNLVDLDTLGVPLQTVNLADDGLTMFGRLMGGVFLLSAARPLSGASEGMRSVFYGGGAVFLIAAALHLVTTYSTLLPGDPMQQLRFAGDGDGLMIRASFSAVYLMCDVAIAIFAIHAGVLFRGAMIFIGVVVAILCLLLVMHDVVDIWFGAINEFGVDFYDDTEDPLGELWFAEAELRWRVMSIVDAVTKVLFALIACLVASRLAHPPAADTSGQGLRAQ